MKDLKSPSEAEAVGVPASGSLPALSPMSSKLPSSAKLLCLDSEAHSLILSTVWLKYGVLGDII